MLDKILYREEWILAIRKRGTALLFEKGGTECPFCLLPNNWRYWAADPFLFKHNKKTYVFFEMYDRWKERGLIGYREIFSNNSFSKMKVALDCGHHLSYPNIFKKDGKIYFVPESYMGNQIVMYRAVDFPDKWEKCKVLVDDIVACDTTFIDDDYMITMHNDSSNTKAEALLFINNSGKWEKTTNNPVDTDPSHARCGGKIFKYGDKLMRPAQDGVGGYGMGVVFREILAYNDKQYKERTHTKITVDDIKYVSKHKYDGVHTYNFNDEYEIIDLKIAKAFHLISIISRL